MFKRIANIFRGFFSLFISDIEKRNPEALLEVEKENLRKQIANYNQGLAAHASHAERLMAQVKKLENDEKELKAKISANVRAGNRSHAGQLALQFQTITQQLDENRKQLEQAEETYQQLTHARDEAIKAAEKKLQELRTGLDDLKIKRATAELSEMASGMISSIGGSGDILNRLHAMVEEDRQKAAGRARVARDSIGTGDRSLKKEEQEALAEQALADFAAREGLPLEPKESPSTAPSPNADPSQGQKRMGPQSQ